RNGLLVWANLYFGSGTCHYTATAKHHRTSEWGRLYLPAILCCKSQRFAHTHLDLQDRQHVYFGTLCISKWCAYDGECYSQQRSRGTGYNELHGNCEHDTKCKHSECQRLYKRGRSKHHLYWMDAGY